jgi:hypothetical protein
MANNNWIEKEDGYHKSDKSRTRGTSPFNKPIPPVRDANGFPLKRNSGGKVDWQKLLEEKQKQSNQ